MCNYIPIAVFLPVRLAEADKFSDNCVLLQPQKITAKNLSALAEVAELVDALDSKSSDGDIMGVRFPPSAPVRAFIKSHII